ncbi:MAG: hypothetical protein COY47_07180, partial [Chloroflexi bacterium CG_4_10_14_0_8_um_filter_57_5]
KADSGLCLLKVCATSQRTWFEGKGVLPPRPLRLMLAVGRKKVNSRLLVRLWMGEALELFAELPPALKPV